MAVAPGYASNIPSPPHHADTLRPDLVGSDGCAVGSRTPPSRRPVDYIKRETNGSCDDFGAFGQFQEGERDPQPIFSATCC